MASRTISLEEGAYRILKDAKRPGESFSMVVRRLAGGRQPSMLAAAGRWHGGLGDAIAMEIEAAREGDRIDARKRDARGW